MNPGWIDHWAAAVSMVTYTDDVGRSVVDMLLQIASDADLRRYLPREPWVWLNKRPSLPPKCRGRELETDQAVVRAVRALGDIETLKSYPLLVWSEWDTIQSLGPMCVLVQEEFSGIRMWGHRADLIRRLDHVLGELGRGFDYIREFNLDLDEGRFHWMEDQYGSLRSILLELDEEGMRSLSRRSPGFSALFPLLTPMGRIPLDVRLRASSSVSVVARLEYPVLLPRPIALPAC
jgi:hypothetical protein